MQKLLTLSFLLTLLGSMIPAAHAQDDRQEYDTARRIYVEGMRFYNDKRYQEASIQLALAYGLLEKDKRLTPQRKEQARQRLRYYLGKSYFKSDQHEKALPMMEDYIRLSKTVSDLKQDDQRVKEIEGYLPTSRAAVAKILAERKAREDAAKRAAAPVATTRPLRPAPFIVLGVGVAALVAAGVIGFLASSQATTRDERFQTVAPDGRFNLADPPNAQEITSLHQQADTFAITANILYIAGGVITATGIILAITLGRGDPVPVSPVTTSLPPAHPPNPRTQAVLLFTP